LQAGGDPISPPASPRADVCGQVVKTPGAVKIENEDHLWFRAGICSFCPSELAGLANRAQVDYPAASNVWASPDEWFGTTPMK